MAMVIGSNVAQAAITLVDARTGCKFTASESFLLYIKNGGVQNRPLATSKFKFRIRMEDVSRSTTFEEPESRQRISNFTSD
jgi:hypothetical protein